MRQWIGPGGALVEGEIGEGRGEERRIPVEPVRRAVWWVGSVIYIAVVEERGFFPRWE